MDGHIFLECNTIPYYLNIPFNNKKCVSVFLEINSCVMVTRLCPRAAWFKLKKERHELSLSLDAIHKLHAICDAGWGGRCRGEGGGGVACKRKEYVVLEDLDGMRSTYHIKHFSQIEQINT